MNENELRKIEFTLDTQVKLLTSFLSKRTHTLKSIAHQIGISERELSTAVKDAGYTYRDRMWVAASFEDPVIDKPLRDFLKLKPVFNQRQIEKIVQLIDSRLACEKEMTESELTKAIDELAPIKKTKTQIKVDKATLKSFEQYCLDHDLNKSDAFTLALQNFMRAYE